MKLALIQISDTVFLASRIVAIWPDEDDPVYICVQLDCTETEYCAGPFRSQPERDKAYLRAVDDWNTFLSR